MGDTTSAGESTITDAQRAWTANFCGIDTTTAAKPGSAPGAPMSLGMRPPASALDRSRDAAVEKIAGESSDIPREKVEAELTEFLIALARAQKTKTVKVTDKVMSVDRVLHDGLGGDSPPLLKQGDTRDYEPADLARKMAQALPDTIPGANVINFRKLRPVEVAPEGSITDDVHHKYEEARDELIRRLPKSVQGLAKKAIDAAVEKGVPFAAEQVFSGLGAGTGMEGVVKQFTDEWAKKITGYEQAHKF